MASPRCVLALQVNCLAISGTAGLLSVAQGFCWAPTGPPPVLRFIDRPAGRSESQPLSRRG